VTRFPDLRLIVITDRRLAAPRPLLQVIEAALAAGAPAVQLRDKDGDAAALVQFARTLIRPVRAAGALLFVNDRLDVAVAAGADGVHLGPDDMPVDAARRVAPARFMIGYSTDDPALARLAERNGASYIGCGAVFGTTTKADVGDERIGLERLADVVRSVSIPVIAIGGITPANIRDVRRTGAAGAAVVSTVMSAPDPGDEVRRLLI
jgi:thiamine-phosphate pyrophosphorylase